MSSFGRTIQMNCMWFISLFGAKYLFHQNPCPSDTLRVLSGIPSILRNSSVPKHLVLFPACSLLYEPKASTYLEPDTSTANYMRAKKPLTQIRKKVYARCAAGKRFLPFLWAEWVIRTCYWFCSHQSGNGPFCSSSDTWGTQRSWVCCEKWFIWWKSIHIHNSQG